MRFKAICLSIVAVVFLIIVLSACSTKPSETTTQPTQPTQGTTPQEPEKSVEIDYPTKNITFLVGSRAGGGYDEWARGLAPLIQKHLPNDVNVIVENEGGANGRIAAVTLQNAKPDGHHINIVNSGIAVTQVLGGMDFDISTWSWLAALTVEDMVLLASNKSGFESLEDILHSDKKPTFASAGFSGAGGTSFLVFANTVGLDFSHIYHNGTSETMLSLVRGDTDVGIGSVESTLEYIKRGDVVPIVYFNKERHPELPDVPSSQEIGYPELNGLGGSRLIAAPPELPDDIREILESAIHSAVHDPDFEKWLVEMNRTIDYRDANQAKEIINGHVQSLSLHKEFLRQYID